MTDDFSKKHPHASSEIARIMGLNPQDGEADLAEPKVSEEELSGAPTNLPFAGQGQPKQVTKILEHPEAHAQEDPVDEELEPPSYYAEANPKKPTGIKFVFNLLRISAPFLAVFAVGIVLYLFFFSSFNFSSLFNSRVPSTSAQVKDTALTNLEKQNLAQYQAWMGHFYYDVSDPNVLDPNTDNSGNGLNNFQKYLLNLNPKSYDTLGLGMADSEALGRGINPLTGDSLTDAQKNVIDSYFDMEAIMGRLALNKAHGTATVAGARTYNNQFVAPAVQDSLDLNSLDINTAVPGRLEVPSLKISVPLIWSQDPKNFDVDLQNGVIHYPGTAMPGQVGTSYISGHSSNYSWAKGSYNKIFSTLGNLNVGDSFSITVSLQGGKQATLHYNITSKKEFSPTDPAQLADTGKPIVALSTCWPVGSTAKRLVVFGELTQTDR